MPTKPSQHLDQYVVYFTRGNIHHYFKTKTEALKYMRNCDVANMYLAKVVAVKEASIKN